MATVRSANWDTWLYMPWRHRWSVGTGDEGGRFCKQHGINGGFLDYGRGPLAWLERWNLRFYVDHVAGKGTLFLRGHPQAPGPDMRPVPLDALRLLGAKAQVADALKPVIKSPMRVAYALDDEISAGAFIRPIPWRINADGEAYKAWLARLYGRGRRAEYVTPDDMRGQLNRAVKDIDLSPLLDRMSYNDSVFANFVGALVEKANEIDPVTPCGFVGAQSPNLWGGYDYAKLARKVQFIEVYDNGSAAEIVRSMSNATVVSTHSRGTENRNSWKAWHYYAHGQRGMIAWVDEQWFEGAWLEAFAPTLKELGTTQGPKLAGARWLSDGIAIYYSHPSIQVSWCLDAEAHGKTWPRRNRDHLLGTSHTVRKAWENLINDAGFQYDFLAYDEVIKSGVPRRYRVLILPACFALSDAEAKRIREFVARGGRVVADFMCGLFDQHGRGRRAGALDDVFGVRHDGSETKRDFFSDRFWVETDQDKGYKAKRWREFLLTLGSRLRDGFHVAERKLEGPVRNGRASYLNLSPLRYLMLREDGKAEQRHRDVFLGRLGLFPAVRVTGDEHVEVIRWKKGKRTLLFVVQNPVLRADGSRAVLGGKTRLKLHFRFPVKDVVNERTGERLGDGEFFRVPFARAEAVFLSYAQDR